MNARCWSVLGLWLAGLPAMAAPVDLGVALSSQYTNNANRQLEDKTGERQDTYLLNLATDYSNGLLDADLRYRASQTRFSENTQEDRSLWEGDARILLGKAYHPVDLLLSHTRRAQLGGPGQLELLSNTDEQQILTVSPSARLRVSPVDYLILRASYSEISYRFAEQRDSSREGGSLIWQRRLSPIDNLNLSVQQFDVSFDQAPDFDYRYQSAALRYSSSLRQLAYSLELGYNRTRSERGADFSAPSYQLELSYQTDPQQLVFSAEQYLTDTSMGSSRGSLDDFNTGGVAVAELDQLKRSSYSLRWSNTALCSRCQVYTALLYDKDQYRELLEDSNERGLSAGINYRLAPPASLGLQLEAREYRYAMGVDREPYRTERARLNYRHQFHRGPFASAFVGYEERKADSIANVYSQTLFGLSLGYDF